MSDATPTPPPAARPTPLRLTDRQRVLLMLIETLWGELGETPSIRALTARFGVASANATWETLRALAKKGWVQLRDGASAKSERSIYRLWQPLTWPLVQVTCWSGPKDAPHEHTRTVRAPTTTWALQWVVEDWLGVRDWARTRQIWRADVMYVDDTPAVMPAPPAAPSLAEDPTFTDAELLALAVLDKAPSVASIEAVEAYTDMPQVTDRLEVLGMVEATDVEGEAGVQLTSKGVNLAAALSPGLVTPDLVAAAIDRDAIEVDAALTAMTTRTKSPYPVQWGFQSKSGAQVPFFRHAGYPGRAAAWVQAVLGAVLEAPRSAALVDLFNRDPSQYEGRIELEAVHYIQRWLLQWGLCHRHGDRVLVTELGRVLLSADLTYHDDA